MWAAAAPWMRPAAAQANRRDFEELPEYLREGLEAHFASTYDDVFAVAFGEEGA